ncbi:cyclic AMP-responsive element-binding protein 3-like protein 3-B [Salvelinus fontinalis]|uniref:cyclic AMP-responsive element-binding protein 3-like protein 3-B n=1 Tax=Salvelinus fontinalis TaxID=8038 RepID=UPI002485772A|nr:cyclic AMP-responsive element-binding protein 3-like protein 3-B [Salvelinus fontinalis]
MDHYSDQGCDGLELLDLLFDQNNGILRHEEMGHHDNHAWPIHEPNVLRPAEQQSEDFLNALLSGSDSVSGSPLWSPSPSDSGISEDPHSDQMDSPQRPESPHMEPHFIPPQPQTKVALDANFSIDINGLDSGFYPGRTGGTECSSAVRRTQLSSGFPLTVKDLLLSVTSDPPPQHSQQSFQELILNENEKKLLAKEGVTLSSQLPLTKYEERILKKIRRKIRNKQSAQESRKKKKEYIDGLESRMAACSTHNQELQRKVFQLEKCNTSLMEQLHRLQTLVMGGSKKTAQAGTCVLVLLLSFSIILFPSLNPFAKVSQGGDFSPVRVQSRSLHNLQSSRVLHVIDQPYQTADDKAKPPDHHVLGDQGVDEIMSLLGKLGTGHDSQGLPNFDPMSHNNSMDEQVHFQGDPITGHIATVTWNPHRRAPLRPHADDM